MLQDFEKCKPEDKDTLNAEIKELRARLIATQQLLREKKLPVLVLIEGWAAAGKGSLIKEIISEIDPRFYNVVSPAVIPESESRYPFLYPYASAIPENGKLIFLDSGWMENVVRKQLRLEISKEEYKRRVRAVNEFERQLRDGGYLVLKIFLHIDKEEQFERLNALTESADTEWRVTPDDLWQHREYKQFMKAYDDFMEKTDETVKWHILDGTKKKAAVRDAMKLLVEKIDKALEKGRYTGEPFEEEFPLLKMPKLSEVDLSPTIEEEEYKKAHRPTVGVDVIYDIIASKTGIPLNRLSADDKKKLSNIDERLKENVIGQDEAINIICKALKRNRVGFKKSGCQFSALMLGRTGVGKTLIAKQLAKEMFGDEGALIRFDMSEYPDKTAVNKLIGSNPGYVGYEEGGQLTEAVKNRKYCVLLLDEIEKADPEVYNIFLQVLDEGFLTDNSGQKVDFKNVIVLFTSNAGAKAASDFGKPVGFGGDVEENQKRILLKQLKNKFPPEFLNRLDNVIYFNALNDEDLRKIIRLEIGKLQKRMLEIGYTMEYDEGTVDYILDIVKEQKEYGARPVVRAIQDEIEDKITDLLLENDYSGHTFEVIAQAHSLNVS